MNSTTQHLAIGAVLLALPNSLQAQNVQIDGLMNAPLGSGVLSLSPTGQLQVDNLGSSGLDGVRCSLPGSDGARVAPDFQLAPNEHCTFIANAIVQGSPTTAALALTLEGQARPSGTTLQPDFSAIGEQTYGMRVFENGQLAYEQSGLAGPSTLTNQAGGDSVPQYIYTVVGSGSSQYLNCVIWDGTVIPPGGNPIDCDVVELFVSNSPVQGIESLDLTVSGPSSIVLASEEMYFLDQFVSGLDNGLLVPTSGKLKVSNLGSSGCDGFSIAPGPGDATEVAMQMDPIDAGQNPGGEVTFECVDASGNSDAIDVLAIGNEWLFSPNFSQLGTIEYTLELYLQGQLVFSESERSGAAVFSSDISSFSKKCLFDSSGTSEAEWSVHGQAATLHTVFNGPTLLADKCVMRSEGNTVLDGRVHAFNLRAGDMTEEILVDQIYSTVPTCVGTNYCSATVNSTGGPAVMCSYGSSSIADNDLTLTAIGTPANNFGIFFYGPNQVTAPFGDGFRCVGGGIYRLPITLSSAAGVMTHELDNTSPPVLAGQILPGQVWNFQAWYRDTAAGGAGFNLSDGHWILFTP
ncbi:MAG: hypothetical protein ACI8X5_002300 [Planctomycetota bacterium]|jgi:hypothetical protein